MAAVMGDEGEFPRTEPQQEPKYRILTDWSIDRLIARLDGWFENFRAHMEHENYSGEHPPADFERDRRELRDLLAGAVREGARMARVEIKDYREGGGGDGEGSSSWQKWMLTVLASLAVLAVAGGVAMFGEISALRAEMQGLKEQVNRVEKIVEPRYRAP